MTKSVYLRVRLREDAFGAGSLFAGYVVSECALRSSVLVSSSDVGITGRGSLGKVDWNTTKDVPLRGMFRGRMNTCYVISVAQVLLRIPAVLDWAICHNAGGCPEEGSACVLCALFQTYSQLLDGTSRMLRQCLPRGVSL